MKRFVSILNKAIDNENWYAALLIALTLPDICGKIESPNERTGSRYCAWVKKYLEPKYTHRIGTRDLGRKHIFLSAGDCYALRCAYLHEGSADITEKEAQESLDKFQFILPPEVGCIHCNQSHQTLQLQIDIFCKDIAEAVEQWLIEIKDDNDIQERMKKLVTIYIPKGIKF